LLSEELPEVWEAMVKLLDDQPAQCNGTASAGNEPEPEMHLDGHEKLHEPLIPRMAIEVLAACAARSPWCPYAWRPERRPVATRMR
jgi:hypothetical protein